MTNAKTTTKTLPPLPQVFLRDCGFQSVKWLLDHAQGTVNQPMTVNQANRYRAMAWVQAYMGHMQDEAEVIHLGGQPEVETALSALLKNMVFSLIGFLSVASSC